MSYRGKVHGLINDGCESSSNTGRGTSDCDGLDTAPSLVCYLMRGLPSTGKSYTARRLAGDTGIVCETDEFFRTQVGSNPNVYDYDSQRLVEAREWNFSRFRAAIDRGVSSVVVDRGNGLSQETRRYAIYAREHNYRVEMAEPSIDTIPASWETGYSATSVILTSEPTRATFSLALIFGGTKFRSRA